jgi:hypothetical protein
MQSSGWAAWGIEDLLRESAADVLVLTANNRLARTVTAQLADTLTESIHRIAAHTTLVGVVKRLGI